MRSARAIAIFSASGGIGAGPPPSLGLLLLLQLGLGDARRRPHHRQRRRLHRVQLRRPGQSDLLYFNLSGVKTVSLHMKMYTVYKFQMTMSSVPRA